MSKRILLVNIDDNMLLESSPSGCTDIDQALQEEAGWMEQSGVVLEKIRAPGPENLKLSIDQESVNIYLDNGDEEEPTHVLYWHLDEVKEDPDVAISIAKAVELFYTNQYELLRISSLPF